MLKWSKVAPVCEIPGTLSDQEMVVSVIDRVEGPELIRPWGKKQWVDKNPL